MKIDRTTSSDTRSRGATRIQVAGLVLAAVGIVVQLAAGVDYPPVPPGLVLLVLSGALLAWRPAPSAVVVGLIVAAVVLVGGLVADPGWRQIGDGGGAATGLLVELVGLVVALVAAAAALSGRARR